MAFRKIQETSPLKEISYNSQESKNFLNMYTENLRESLLRDPEYIPNKSFTPSSIRCKRMNWFRLRGTKLDSVSEPDIVLKFIADIGTHCHETIQSKLKKYLKEDWLDVKDYLDSNPPSFKYELDQNGFETKIKVQDPPVRFSCDGIIRYHDKIYLLEIKTSEPKSMKSLVGPKSEHLDQVKCYCTLMGIDDAMVLYQDRQYGHMKCFTYHMKQSDKDQIVGIFEDVQNCVKKNIIPEGLPKGDKWCSPSYCPYYKKCRRWG